MDYRERLTWANFVPALCFFAFWAFALLRTWQGASVPRVNFTATLLLLAAVQAVTSGLVAGLARRRERPDERETAMSLQTFRWAYYAMLWGSILWVGVFYQGRQPEPGTTAFALLLFLFGVEVLRSGLLLFLYERGARA